MTFVASVILLAIVLISVHSEVCPNECKCDEENTYYKCNLKNGTIKMELDARNGSFYSTLTIRCKSEIITHVQFPRLDAQSTNVELYSCSPSILREVHVILDEPVIKNVKLYNVSQPLKSEDIADFEYATWLELELFADTLIPVNAISSWSSMEYIAVTGGMFQVSSNDFNNSTSLDLFRLTNSKVKAVPNGDFYWLPNIERLVLENNGIEEIRVGAFKGLNNLKGLSIENSIKLIDLEAFGDVPQLHGLMLINVLLESLPNELFQRNDFLEFVSIECAPTMKQKQFNLDSHAFSKSTLNNVVLKSCKINNVMETLFSDANDLLYLSISNNIINHLPSNIFFNQTKLIELLLNNNSLHYLPSGIFDTFQSLRVLNLNDNALLDLPNRIFDNLTSLATLKLGNNGLRRLQENIFSDLTALNTLNLEGNNLNKLSDSIFINLLSLETLNLAGNGILKLPLLDDLKLKVLNLTNNKITQLEYIHLNELISLDLSGNKLKELRLCMFCGFENLIELNLSNNKIMTIASAFEKGLLQNSPFLLSPKLEILDLSGNKLRKFFVGWTSALPQIRKLNLSSNRLDDIEVFQNERSNLSIIIDLRHNNISKIELSPTASFSSSESPATSQLLLDDNPLNCDCNAFGLLLRLKGARLHHGLQYIFNNSKCYSPPNLKGNLLEHISPTDLVCDLSKHSPNNCSSVIVNAGYNEVTLQCSTMPASLPDPKADYFPSFYDKANITLKLDEQPQSISNFNINRLNLSNAKIHRITFKPTAVLKEIDLSYNYLTTIPEDFINENITLYLSGNLLKCDCRFVSSLIKSKSLADPSKVLCVNEGKTFTDIDASELCNRTMTLISFIGTTAVSGSFLTMIAVALCKYVRRNWSSIINSVCRRTPENVVTPVVTFAVKLFDLYLSFVDQDEEFIRENFVLKLEHDFTQNVYLHYRDWTMDDPVPDQIIQSINNSKRTVIILTEDYLLSEWSDFTFNKARSLEIQEGTPKLIIILLDKEVLKHERLNDELKSYIAAHSYLQWGDPNFWQTFRDIIHN